MKRPLLIHFLLALLWIVPINELTAQIKCKIDNYSTEDCLSHDAVGYILKDKEGFMWFATWDGINRFDGKNFITYKATAGDNTEKKPSFSDMVNRAKWDAWNNLKGTEADAAKQQYIDLIASLS